MGRLQLKRHISGPAEMAEFWTKFIYLGQNSILCHLHISRLYAHIIRMYAHMQFGFLSTSFESTRGASTGSSPTSKKLNVFYQYLYQNFKLIWTKELGVFDFFSTHRYFEPRFIFFQDYQLYSPLCVVYPTIAFWLSLPTLNLYPAPLSPSSSVFGRPVFLRR